MDKVAFLARRKSKVTSLDVDGDVIYLRNPTIGDNNFMLFERQAYLLERAKQLGIQINMEDETLMNNQLKQISDPYVLARGAAMRLCDEQGELLFNVRNTADLDDLNKLDESLLTAINGLFKKKS